MTVEKIGKLGKFVNTLFYYKQKAVNWNLVANSGSIDILTIDRRNIIKSDMLNSEISLQLIDGITLNAEKFIKITENIGDKHLINIINIDISKTVHHPELPVLIKKIIFSNPILSNNKEHTIYPNVTLGGGSKYDRNYHYSEQFTRSVVEADLDRSKSGDSEIKVSYQKTPKSTTQQLSIATLPRTIKYLFEDINITSRKYIEYAHNDDVLTLIKSTYIFKGPKILEYIASGKGHRITNSIISFPSLKTSYRLIPLGKKLDTISMNSISSGINSSLIIRNLSLLESLSN